MRAGDGALDRRLQCLFHARSPLGAQGRDERLTKLVRSTGERLQTLRRVSDRLKATNYSSEIKAKLARELKLDSEVHHAEEEHVLAQAGMMKQGLQPTDTHAEAADKAAQTVPVDIQRRCWLSFT